MIFAVLACISLMLLGAAWVLYRRNLELFLCFLIAINFEFFYLVPSIAGADNYKLLLLPMLTVLLLENLLRGQLSLGRYGLWVAGFLGLSVLGVLVAWSAGQGVTMGIKAAKFIPLVMVYFLLAGRMIEAERFSRYFIVMGLGVASLATVSYMTHGAFNLFPGLPRELAEQSGRLRVTAGQFVISLGAIIAFARFWQGSRPWYILASALLFTEVVIVQQTRGFIVAGILSMVVVFILSRKITLMRVTKYTFFSVCLALSMLLASADLSNIGFVKRTQTDMVKRGGSYGGSLQARLNAYEYYWKELQKQPLTGRGMMNFNWEGNPDRKLQKKYGIHLSDIGVMSLVVQAGLAGVAWLVYGLLRLWRGILTYGGRHLVPACYFIIGTFSLPTLDMFFRNECLFLFGIFLGLSSSVIMAAKAEKVQEAAPDPWSYQSS